VFFCFFSTSVFFFLFLFFLCLSFFFFFSPLLFGFFFIFCVFFSSVFFFSRFFPFCLFFFFCFVSKKKDTTPVGVVLVWFFVHNRGPQKNNPQKCLGVVGGCVLGLVLGWWGGVVGGCVGWGGSVFLAPRWVVLGFGFCFFLFFLGCFSRPFSPPPPPLVFVFSHAPPPCEVWTKKTITRCFFCYLGFLFFCSFFLVFFCFFFLLVFFFFFHLNKNKPQVFSFPPPPFCFVFFFLCFPLCVT